MDKSIGKLNLLGHHIMQITTTTRLLLEPAIELLATCPTNLISHRTTWEICLWCLSLIKVQAGLARVMSFFMLFDRKHTLGFMVLINTRKGLTGVVRKKEKTKIICSWIVRKVPVNNTTRQRKREENTGKITRRLTCLNNKTLNIFINQIHIFFKYTESVFVCVYINTYIYI